MSLGEKEFILDFILKDIIYTFGSLIIAEPGYSEGEIDSDSEIFCLDNTLSIIIKFGLESFKLENGCSSVI